MKQTLVAVTALALISSVAAAPFLDTQSTTNVAKNGPGGKGGKGKSGNVGKTKGNTVHNKGHQKSGSVHGPKIKHSGNGGKGGNVGKTTSNGGTNNGPSIGAGANIQTGPVGPTVNYMQQPNGGWTYGPPAPAPASNGITIGGAQTANGGTNKQHVSTNASGGVTTGDQKSGSNRNKIDGGRVQGGRSGSARGGAGGASTMGNKQKGENANSNSLSAEIPLPIPRRSVEEYLSRRFADPDIYEREAEAEPEPEFDETFDIYAREAEPEAFDDDLFEEIYRRAVSSAYMTESY